MAVYTLGGQQVVMLVRGVRVPGSYLVAWDGRSEKGRLLASGLYLYRLKVGNQVATRKLLLVR